MKNDTVCKEKASNVFLKECEQYFKIEDLKAQLQDKNIAIIELKKLIEKCRGKFVETKKPSVVRQPNAQRILKPSVLGKPIPFSDSLERKSFSKTKSVPKINVSEGLSKPVTTQIWPQTGRQAVRNTNVIKPGMNTDPRLSTSTVVIHRTNVSRLPLRSTKMKDKVVPNNSQVKVKKTEVEDHHRISSTSNKTKSVTTCNDSLKSRTSNVNAIFATCGKCVFNLNHDACVFKFVHDVIARTKKPKVVPISTRQPKSQANKSVATPPKKIVASESTIQKSKSYYRMLYEKTSKAFQAVAATEGNPAIQQHTTIETVLNMTPENKEHFLSEKEAIFLLLTGIGDDIYSTVDACKTANEMWIAIERLQQGESLNVQDVKTNLFWEFGKFTSRDGESMESYYSRFYKLMNELTRNNLQVTTMQVNVQFLQQLQPEWSRFVTVVKQSKEIDTISYHTLFDILKQYQNEVNDIRAERIAKSANPLALLAAAQPYSDNYYQAPKPQRSNATSSSTRPSASTRHKGKEIAKPVTPQSESVSEEDSDPEQAQRDKDMQKNLALLAKYFKRLYKPTNNNLRTSSNSRNKTEDTTPRYNNDNQSGQFGNQRTMTVAGARETVGSQEVLPGESSSTEQPLEQVQNHDEDNVFANERRHSEQPESINDTYVLEKDDRNNKIGGKTTQFSLQRKRDLCISEKEREQYHEIQDLKAQMQDKNIAISELKKLIEKCKGKSVETQFDKPSVVRQPNAQRILKPSVLGKPTPFSNSPEMRRMYRIATSTTQNREPQLPHASRNTNPHVSTSIGVNHSTSVSRPQLKSYQVKDKVVPNNSHVKFTKKEVEDHHRISSISKKTKSVTACTDSSNSRTLNVNAVCVECGKCMEMDGLEKKCPLEYKWTQTTPSRPSLKWKPTGRIFSNVRLRWVPTGKLFNSCTGKVDSEPTHGSIVDIPHIHACKQTLGLSAGTSFNGQKQQRIDLNADALYNAKQENLRVWLLKMLISKKPVPEWFHKR
ncbi:hypothetical protein Tco_1313975 [Tanacetum coccineum]